MSHFPEDQEKKPRDMREDGAPDAEASGVDVPNDAENRKDAELPQEQKSSSQPSAEPPPKLAFRRVTGPIKITPPGADERILSTAEEIVQELPASGRETASSEPVKFFPDTFFEGKPAEELTPADYQQMMRGAGLGEPILDEIRQALEQHPNMLYVPKSPKVPAEPVSEEIPEEIAVKDAAVAFPQEISVAPAETEPEPAPETKSEPERVPPEVEKVKKPATAEIPIPELDDNIPDYIPPLAPEIPLPGGLIGYMTRIGAQIENWICNLGNFTYFACQVVWWMLRFPRRGTLLPCMYEIGIMSLPVIALTGTFIGMVLSVQSYHQLKDFYLETRMGALINLSLVRELGPVLAATMLAGRIGSSMAAELGTMRVTEQIDAMSSMGVNPVHYLVVPRFLGCMMLIPVLTIVADFMGIVGGAYLSVWVYGVDWHFYLTNSNKIVGSFDIFIGVFKSVFFGAAIGLIGCHRGFNSRAGAEGVGKAATEAFVFSFVTILMLDLALGIILDSVNLAFISTGPKKL